MSRTNVVSPTAVPPRIGSRVAARTADNQRFAAPQRPEFAGQPPPRIIPAGHSQTTAAERAARLDTLERRMQYERRYRDDDDDDYEWDDD
jgi:hypothetical protein